MENQPSDEKTPDWETIPESAKSDGRGRRAIVGGAAGVLLICCCLATLVAGLLIIDPFRWQVMDRLTGRYDPVASAMPDDTAVYIGLDALAFTPQKINRVIHPFLGAAGDPDLRETEDALDQFDQGLQAELGLTIQDDIMPWVGQYAGLGITDLQADLNGDLQQLSLIVAISTRDKGASDVFLEKLAAGVTRSTGYSFSQESYAGVTIYVMDNDDLLEQLAFGRSGNLVLIGSGLTEVQRAIDVRSGPSLAATDNYRTVISELPGGRGLTVYVDGGRFEEVAASLASGVGAGIGPGTLSAVDFASAALAMSIIDEGLQLDFVSKGSADQLGTATQERVEAGSAANSADQFFPEQTVLFFSGQRLDLTWAAIRQGFVEENSQADWDEAMALFANEFSVNPDTELVPYLDGDWGLGILPANSGLLVDELDINLGVAWLVHTSDPDALTAALNSLADGLDFQGFSIEQQPMADGFAYSLSLSAGDDPVLLFGLDGNQMFLTSDRETTQNVLANEGPALADSDGYRQVWATFPRGQSPAFYLDVQGLLGAIQVGLPEFERQDFDEARPILEPLSFIAATSDSEIAGDDLIRHVSTIFFIEQTE